MILIFDANQRLAFERNTFGRHAPFIDGSDRFFVPVTNVPNTPNLVLPISSQVGNQFTHRFCRSLSGLPYDLAQVSHAITSQFIDTRVQ